MPAPGTPIAQQPSRRGQPWRARHQGPLGFQPHLIPLMIPSPLGAAPAQQGGQGSMRWGLFPASTTACARAGNPAVTCHRLPSPLVQPPQGEVQRAAHLLRDSRSEAGRRRTKILRLVAQPCWITWLQLRRLMQPSRSSSSTRGSHNSSTRMGTRACHWPCHGHRGPPSPEVSVGWATVGGPCQP